MNHETIWNRVASLRERMSPLGLDAFALIVVERSNWEGAYYISGFRGSSSGIVITQNDAVLVTDGRYATQSRSQSPFDVRLQGQRSLTGALRAVIAETGARRIGYEAERISVRKFEELRMENASVEWVDASDLLPLLRRKKDAGEIALIRKAADIARDAYLSVLSRVRNGMTELEFSAALEYEIRCCGAEGGWGDHGFIIASGPRSALPHGMATDKPLSKGDWVTVDYGARVDGYVSDITRNFAIGEPPSRVREIEDVLLRAHEAAAGAIRAGVSGREVDLVARKIIQEAGYGEHFIHGLGHAIGLEVHESPRLSPISADILQEGDVVTVEPGIYIEGFGGLRIEDDYLVTASGPVLLTEHFDRRLSVL